MDTSKQTGVYSQELKLLVDAIVELEIRLQRISEAIHEIDLTLQMLVDK